TIDVGEKMHRPHDLRVFVSFFSDSGVDLVSRWLLRETLRIGCVQDEQQREDRRLFHHYSPEGGESSTEMRDYTAGWRRAEGTRADAGRRGRGEDRRAEWAKGHLLG